MHQFCALNNMRVPNVVVQEREEWPFAECAYYRPTQINICVSKCAHIGTAGMAWSFPGHQVDRTPYGVIAHELGHHVDITHSTNKDRYRGNFSRDMRDRIGEKPLTSYCPDDGEWFAEMFRLFVTNPNLLAMLRPGTHAAIREKFVPVFNDGWRLRLVGAPDRTIAAIEKKLM